MLRQYETSVGKEKIDGMYSLRNENQIFQNSRQDDCMCENVPSGVLLSDTRI